MTADRRVVIVGSGQAGTTVAITLRERGFDGPITVIGSEPHLPYERPPLSKQFLHGDVADRDLDIRPATYFIDRAIELLTGRTVSAIDRPAGAVVLDDGRRCSYRWLVLATGTRPVIPDVPGIDLDGVHVLRSIDDARRLRRRFEVSRHLTAIGGGFIGLELAAAAQKSGVDSTVVDLGHRVLARAVTDVTSEHLTAFHRQRGTSFHSGAGLAEVRGHRGRVRSVITTAGLRIDTDTVVVAIGVRPDVDLAAAADLPVRNGIVVDGVMRTADPRIFAAGDCANFPDTFSGRRIRIESVQAATDQARLIARQIAGETVEAYAALPWFWSHQGPMKLQIAGYTETSDTDVVRGDVARGKFSVFRYLDGTLRAVESINRPADHVAARRWLADGTSPSPRSVAEAPDLRSLSTTPLTATA